jgi:excisionase family DNA binding protein
MGQHLVGLVEVAQFLGLVSRGNRPGNRVWELLRSGKLKGLPHVRIGRTYRFNMSDVEAWVRRQAAGGLNGAMRPR